MYSEKPLYEKDFILCKTKLDNIFFGRELCMLSNHGISQEREAAALRDYLKIHRWANIKMDLLLHRCVAEWVDKQVKPRESWGNWYM